MTLGDNSSPARQRFLSLNTYRDLNNLVENADCEDLYLECKEQASPTQISRNILAKSLSGFSNTSGGVIAWGIQTDKKDGNDVITQLLPVGNIETFKKRIANIIPTLTVPSITNAELKVIKRTPTDTKGYLIGYIPAVQYRPTQSIADHTFYLRSGDQFTVAPYEFIQRLFSAQDTPDIKAEIPNRLLKYDSERNRFEIPVCVNNRSVAVGREVLISVNVLNYKDIGRITTDSGLLDISSLNSGKKIYSAKMDGVLHRGFPTVLGYLYLTPTNKRMANVKVSVFADRMVATNYIFKVYAYKSKPRAVLDRAFPEY